MDKLLHISCFVLLCFITLSCKQPASKVEKSADKNNKVSKQECIDRVIALDNSLGKIRNHDCKTVSLSQAILNYTQGIKKIDYSNCPETFIVAFEKHRQAWLEILSVTDEYPNLRGEMHDLFKILEEGNNKEDFKPLLESIWDTWGEIEKSMEEKNGN